MRVLFVCYAETTHFLGMVPLAWAVQAAGHEVRVASQPRLSDPVTSAGLTAVPVGVDHKVARLARADPAVFRRRSFAVMPPPFNMAGRDFDELDRDDVREGWGWVVPWWFRMCNDGMVEDLVEFSRAWRPDFVVWEMATHAGALAAEAVGVRHARMLWAPDYIQNTREQYLRINAEDGRDEDVLGDWLARWAKRLGFAYREEVTCGDFSICQLPASMRLGTSVQYADLRYVPYNGRAVVPDWVWRPTDRPRVGMSLGLSAAQYTGNYEISVADALDALSSLDVEVVATVAEHVQRDLPTLPDNVRVVEFVPLSALVPTCAAMIHHGGWGTLMTSFVSGVPQLVCNDNWDVPFMTGPLVDRGAARVIPTRESTGERIRAELLHLLEEPSYTEAAAGMRDEYAARPTPGELAVDLPGTIERMVAAQRLDGIAGGVGAGTGA